MKLYEYEAEDIAKKAGITIPKSILVETPDQAVQAYKRLNTTVIMKVQILTSGRGKAGGIIRADNEEEKLAEKMKSGIRMSIAAYIAGITAPKGKQMGHAGAIISMGTGTAEEKKK